MIKTGALNNQSPSLVSGQRGTVVKNGEAVLPKEQAPTYTEHSLAYSLNKEQDKDNTRNQSNTSK